MRHPPLKNEAPPTEKQPNPPPPIEKCTPLPENDPQKNNPGKLETVINTRVSIIKQLWKKTARNSTRT